MDSDPILLLAAAAAGSCVALTLVLAFRRHARLAVVAWVVTLFFTPIWLGVQAGIFVTALTAMTVLVVISSIGVRIAWSPIDSIMVVLAVTIALAVVVGGSTWGHVVETLTMWLLPYVWGRLILARVSADWIAACLAVVAVAAALLAIVEFVTAQNIFHSIPGASSSVWGTEQIRAGLPRSEGAFGHSIALGGALAISSAFVLTVTWRPWIRLSAWTIIAVGAALTFSRIGLVGLVITVLLSVIFLGRSLGRAVRIGVTAVVAVAAIAGLPLLLRVFGDAGAEAEGSAEYRVNLVSLIDSMAVIGISPDREVLATGEDYYGGFRSIDSALILIGLRFGAVPMAILILLLVLAVLSVVRGRGSPAAVALVAQVPAFATVALITQYSAFVWFAAGLAVASYSLNGGRDGHLARDGAPLAREVTAA